MASEFIEVISEQTKAQIDAIMPLVRELANEIKTINGYKASNTPSGADKGIQGMNEAYKQQANAIKLLKLENDKLFDSQKKEEQLKQQKLTTQTKETNAKKANLALTEAETRASEKKTQKLTEEGRAYNKILAKQQAVTKQLRDLVIETGKESEATKKLQTQLNALNAELLQAEQASKKYAMGASSLATPVLLYADAQKKATQATKEANAEKAKTNAMISKQMTGQMVESVNAIGRPSESLKRMGDYYRELEKTSAAEAKSVTANQNLNRAYVQLTANREKAKQKLQDLIASETASNAEIRKAQKEFDVLNKKVAAADKAVGRFSDANRKINGLASSVGNLMAAFGVSTGLYLFVDIVKGIYDTTKALQSMDLALKMVSETPLEFAKNQQFVTEVSEKWGLEIKSLQQTYTQFYTASKGLLTDDSIKTTFEGIAKAGSIMGLSLEQQQSAFYAIDQMMSKGTVTAEELKKQLGNAMPGAIKAAAMAYMELHPAIKSIQEAEEALYADMKKGAIDSATYVPLIAKNFQILYGIESLNSVHTMQAAQNRLQNSWTEWVRGLGQGGAGAKMMVSLMESLAKNLDTVATVLGFSVTGWLAYNTAVMLANAQTKLLALTTTTATVATARQTVVIGFQTTAQVANATATNIATTAWQRFMLALKANALGLIIAGLYLAYEGFQYLTKSVEDTTAAVKEKNSAFINNREIVTEAIIDTESLMNTYNDLSKKTKLSKDEQLELNRVTKELAKIVPGAVIGVNQYGEAIKLNTETLKKYNSEKKKQLELERKSSLRTERELYADQVKDIAQKEKLLAKFKEYKGQGSITQERIDEMELALSIAKQEKMLTGGRIITLKAETEAEKNAAKAKAENTKAGKEALVKDVDWYDAQIKILKDKEGKLSDVTGKEGKALQKQIKDLQAKRNKIAGEEPKKEKKKKIDKSIEEANKLEYDLKMSNLEVQKQLAQDEIDLANAVTQNKEIQYQDVIDATKYYNGVLIAIEKAKYDEEVRLAGENSKEKEIAYNKWFISTLKLSKEMAESLLKVTQDFAKDGNDVAKQMLSDFEENAKKFEEIDKRMTQAKIDNDQTKLEAQRKAFNEFMGSFADKSGFGETFDLLGKINPETGKTILGDLLDTDDKGEKAKAYFLAVTTVAQDAMNAIDQADEARYQRRLARLEKEKEVALGFAGDSAAAKEKIEADFDKKKKALEIQEFKRKQKMTIANIAIDTAQAAMASWAKTGFPWAAAAAIAMGAIQIGIVASQKPPEYWTGTDNAEAGLAWTQERGAEIVTDKKGNIKDFGDNKGARLTMMEAGDKVYNAEQTKRLMFNNELNSILMDNGIGNAPKVVVNSGMTKADLREVMLETLGEQPQYHTNITEGGITNLVIRNGNITKTNSARGNSTKTRFT